MRSLRRRNWAVFGAVLVAGLVGRFVWAVNASKIGWISVRDGWLSAAVGLARRGLWTPVGMEPAAQARYWTAKSRQVRSAISDPDIAEGAAWILDRPSSHYLGRFVSPTISISGDVPYPSDQTTRQTIRSGEDKFDVIADEERCAAIESAKELDPQSPERWRSRAWLLFRSRQSEWGLSPRDPDWNALLDECAAHDPDNALYDYLSAVGVSPEVFTFDREALARRLARWAEEQSDLDSIASDDRSRYQQAVDCFDRGQLKLSLRMNARAHRATLCFLEQAQVAPLDRLQLLESLSINQKRSEFFITLHQWRLGVQSEQLSRCQWDAAQRTLDEWERLSRQSELSDDPPDLIQLLLKQTAISRHIAAAREHPEQFTLEHVSSLVERQRNVLLEYLVLEEGIRRVNAVRSQREPDFHRPVLLLWCVQRGAMCLLEISVVAAAISTFLHRFNSPPGIRTGVWPHILCWSIGTGASFVLFGLCATGVITDGGQTWLVRTAVCLVPISAVGAALLFIRRRSGLRWDELVALWTLGLVLGALVVIPGSTVTWVIGHVSNCALGMLILELVVIALAGWWAFHVVYRFLLERELPPRTRYYVCAALLFVALWGVAAMPGVLSDLWDGIAIRTWISTTQWTVAKDWTTTTTRLLRHGMKLPERSLSGAIAVWGVERGLLAAAAMSLALLALWVSFREWRARDTIDRATRWAILPQIMNHVARSVAQSSAIAAALTFVVYLSVVPGAFRVLDLYYEARVTALCDHERTKQEVDGAVAAIRADEIAMKKLRSMRDERSPLVNTERNEPVSMQPE